jgi:hypothetical protein
MKYKVTEFVGSVYLYEVDASTPEKAKEIVEEMSSYDAIEHWADWDNAEYEIEEM